MIGDDELCKFHNVLDIGRDVEYQPQSTGASLARGDGDYLYWYMFSRSRITSISSGHAMWTGTAFICVMAKSG